MEPSSGLSIKDAQYMICKGTYGGKEWSLSDRQKACHRYEELTGTRLETDASNINLPLVIIFVLPLIIVLGYVIYRYKNKRKLLKK